jgi:hypothetical protein
MDHYWHFNKYAGISRRITYDGLIAITFGLDASLCCHKGSINKVNGEYLFLNSLHLLTEDSFPRG